VCVARSRMCRSLSRTKVTACPSGAKAGSLSRAGVSVSRSRRLVLRLYAKRSPSSWSSRACPSRDHEYPLPLGCVGQAKEAFLPHLCSPSANNLRVLFVRTSSSHSASPLPSSHAYARRLPSGAQTRWSAFLPEVASSKTAANVRAGGGVAERATAANPVTVMQARIEANCRRFISLPLVCRKALTAVACETVRSGFVAPVYIRL
jgi:hypothetical protein